MQTRLKGLLPNQDHKSQDVLDWERVHLLCFGSVMADWRHFINYLDREISKMVSRQATGKRQWKHVHAFSLMKSFFLQSILRRLESEAYRSKHMQT